MFRVNNKVLENFQRPAKFVRKANFIKFYSDLGVADPAVLVYFH